MANQSSDSTELSSARYPWHLGWDDLREVADRVWNERSSDDISDRAAAVAYSGLFSIPPLLIAVISLYGLVASPQSIADLIDRVDAVMPAAATELLTTQLESLIEQRSGSLSVGVLLGLAGALWGVSGGMNRLRETINEVYEEEDSRPWYVKRAWAALASAGLILFIVISLGLIVLTPSVLEWAGTGGVVRVVGLILRWVLLGTMMVALLGALYRVGPKRTSPQIVWMSAGTITAALAWVIMSVGFGLYVQYVGSYNATYGSLGTVIIFLMWLYLTAYIVLMAGELNAELEHQTIADTTVGPTKPMGDRGAYVADTTPSDTSA